MVDLEGAAAGEDDDCALGGGGASVVDVAVTATFAVVA